MKYAPVQARVNETAFETIAGWCSLLVVYLSRRDLPGTEFRNPFGIDGKHPAGGATTCWWTGSPWRRSPGGCPWCTIVSHGAAMSWSSSSRWRITPKGKPEYPILVKRLIGVPGDHIRLNNGIVSINGIAQSPPREGKDSPTSDKDFVDEFPSVLPTSRQRSRRH